MTEQEKWSAIETRDPSYDGLFVFAVASTGVFCRPACPARRPLRQNVRFFATPVEAEAAGFRACRRCRPKSVPAQSESKRLALKATGLSAREWKSAERITGLKAALKRGSNVTDALYEAGFGSSSRLYETAAQRMGMTPGEYRRGAVGLQIQYVIENSRLGRVLAAETKRGICAVFLGDSDDKLRQSLRTEFPGATIERGGEDLASRLQIIVDSLGASGEARALPLDLHGTAFQMKVWEELRKIPRGETRSYAEVASAIGRPTAYRAVARAIATNPVALLVPCHRVIESSGALAGYRWGPQRKKKLLAGERDQAEAGAESRPRDAQTASRPREAQTLMPTRQSK